MRGRADASPATGHERKKKSLSINELKHSILTISSQRVRSMAATCCDRKRNAFRVRAEHVAAKPAIYTAQKPLKQKFYGL